MTTPSIQKKVDFTNQINKGEINMIAILYLILNSFEVARSSALREGLCRERISISGFINSPPTLAVYGVAHYLPLGGVE